MKYFVIESSEGDWEVWSNEDTDNKDEAALMAVVYDEDLATEVVGMLNDKYNEDEGYELEPDEEYGEAVDEFIKGDKGFGAWDGDNN